MRVSSRARHAISALADLAVRPPGKAVSLAELSEGQDISFSYLEQLFARLRRAGILRSVRGPGGGYLLAMDAAQISIADIIRATEDAVAPAACVPNRPGACIPGPGRCTTHGLWAAIDDHLDRFLASVTLGDVVSGRFSQTAHVMDIRQDLAATGE